MTRPERMSHGTGARRAVPDMEPSSLPRRIFASVFLTSLAVLVVQIALNRLFSYTLWYHFAYISITLALLGFGASGSLLVAFPGLGSGSLAQRMGVYGVAAAASTAGMLVVLGLLQVNPFFVLTSLYELAKFVLLIVIGTVPFAFAGLAISLALRDAGPATGRLYFWDLVGAGLGCALVVPAIELLGTPRVILLGAGLYAVAAWILVSGRFRHRITALMAALLVLAIVLPDALPFPVSKDKDVGDSRRQGDSTWHRWGSLFRTDMVDGGDASVGGYAGFGLGSRHRGPTPPFRMIFHDGTAGAVMYVSQGEMRGMEIFRNHILTLPYIVKRAPDALVIGVGGGADIANGVMNGARSVTGVELDPNTVRIITRDFGDLTRGYIDRPEVQLHVGEGRSFVRSSDREFDLVQITGVDTLAALSSGAYVLAENFLYTTEAYADFFSRLKPDGLLSICSADFHPRTSAGRHAARFASLSADALRAAGVAHPEAQVLIVGTTAGIALFEIMTSMTPFTAAQIEAVRSFAADNGFEIWYAPGHTDTNLPVFTTILAEDSASRDAFYEQSRLDLRATTDDAPFFFSHYKWRHLAAARHEIDVGHSLATGQVVLVVLLLASVFFSVVAIAFPLLRVRGRGGRLEGGSRYLVYFGALGAGFIFLEISFVQRFILFLGYPTYSLTVTLASFLVGAGLGANTSSRLPMEPARVLPKLAVALSVLVLLYVLVLPSIFDMLRGTHLSLRVMITVALCGPLGFLLGMFFPFGIRHVAALDRDFVPWAWATNGCLTVIGSVASIMLAMTWGFRAVSVLALLIYWVGVMSFLRAPGKALLAGSSR